jgi:antitoxin CptB
MEMSAAGRARLWWRCRRGMRELDELLVEFLERKYDAQGPALRAAFQRLLEMEDPDLYACLLGQVPAPDQELQDVIDSIRRR